MIKGCIRQDATCQRLLYEQLSGKMFTVCLRYANDLMEAEDLLQEGFIVRHPRGRKLTEKGKNFLLWSRED